MKNDISIKSLSKTFSLIGAAFLFIIIFLAFEVYIPLNPKSHETVIFTVEKGWSDDIISQKLEEAKIIRDKGFFSLYVISTLRHNSLQAGKYNLSPNMSIHEIATKMASGNVIKDTITILEGWDVQDIDMYLESKGLCNKGEFQSLSRNDYFGEFGFLSDKSKNVGLEGYFFPDTYEIAKGDTCQDVIDVMLDNFGKKIAPYEEEIKKQNKTIFQVVTMASLLEKEVRTLEDKKIVSGILWKRLAIGMPLQLDSTVNYATGKSDPSVLIKDTKIDSPYNTYKHYGLPLGPIASPGIDSITAAVYPEKTKYLYYLSDGITHFSETLEQHNEAKAKYLKY